MYLSHFSCVDTPSFAPGSVGVTLLHEAGWPCKQREGGRFVLGGHFSIQFLMFESGKTKHGHSQSDPGTIC